jgi:hypothetical protein
MPQLDARQENEPRRHKGHEEKQAENVQCKMLNAEVGLCIFHFALNILQFACSAFAASVVSSWLKPESFSVIGRAARDNAPIPIGRASRSDGG